MFLEDNVFYETMITLPPPRHTPHPHHTPPLPPQQQRPPHPRECLGRRPSWSTLCSCPSTWTPATLLSTPQLHPRTASFSHHMSWCLSSSRTWRTCGWLEDERHRRPRDQDPS